MADRDALMQSLRGRVIPAVLTPMTADATPHWADFDRYAEYIVGAPIGGVAVWAHTGRGLFLTEDDRRLLLTRWRASTDRPVIAGVGVPIGSDAVHDPDASCAATLRMADTAAELGADALMIYPPAVLRDRPDDDRLLDLHLRAAERTGLPIVGFHLHGEAGGYDYGTELQDALNAQSSVIGVKAATLDRAIACQQTLRISATHGKLAITGEDRMFGPSLMWGADCALIGIAAAAANLSIDVVDAWQAGDYGRFVSASRRLDRFAEATFCAPIEGYIRRMMAAAQFDGALSDDGANDPFGPKLERGELTAVNDVLRSLHATAGA